MAQKVHIVLEDDIDGGPADETITFALDGANYEIDLSTANAAKLRDALALYVSHGRRTGGSARRGRRGSSGSTGDAKVIREWAKANGHAVPDRGRIPADVRSAYEAAQH